jgi:pyridoxamine 5'-phosphate oxidase
VTGRSALEKALDSVQKKYPQDPPRPPYWGGYRVIPERMEFWQGRPNRLHDRLQYLREGNGWTLQRLAP